MPVSRSRRRPIQRQPAGIRGEILACRTERLAEADRGRQRAISSVKPAVLSARLRSVLECDARAELEKIAVPILYLQAEQDRVVNTSCLEEIQRIKPEIAVSIFSGSHLLLQREPQNTADCVADSVRQLA